MPRAVVSALKIGEPIGSGHFGTMHVGEHPIHGKVAIKVLERLPGESDQEWGRRKEGLLYEGQRLKDAEHDRMVRVFDISHDAKADKIYLVLEYCQHGSLEVLYSKGPIELSKLRDLITDVTLGLVCIHSRNLLHRDIKPANILIGNDYRAKLGDFGLVTDRLILGYGSMQGYLDHIAPEVWEEKRTSVRSDIWALGMTIYRLLHGQVYYDKLDPPREKVVQGSYANSLTWLSHIPKAWRSFIKKCMRDDPSKRYQNAQQVLTAISALPIDGGWLCEYKPTKTIWRRQRGKRLNIVTHTVHSPRKHEWYAISIPASGEGRKMCLGKSNGIISKRSVMHELEEFFRTH